MYVKLKDFRLRCGVAIGLEPGGYGTDAMRQSCKELQQNGQLPRHAASAWPHKGG